jgi:hypothetical protein
MPSFVDDHTPSVEPRDSEESDSIETYRVPLYNAATNPQFEIEVIGYDLRILHFAPIVGGLNLSNVGERQEAHHLMYRYRRRNGNQRCHSLFFVGAKPSLHFLVEDCRYQNAPIIEYRLIKRRNGRLILNLVSHDATQDPHRIPFGSGHEIYAPDQFIYISRDGSYSSVPSSDSTV